MIRSDLGENKPAAYLSFSMTALNVLRIFLRSDRQSKPPATAVFGIARGVKASRHENGIVFLHSSKGTVFSANGVGASIWQGVCDGRSVDEISSAIIRQFDAPPDSVRRDTASFIASLLSEGILDRATL